MNRTGKYEMDMCSGPIFGKVIRFSVPLMLTSVLQLLFNAADIVVVGQFAGHTALAAVGSTGALINLIINVLMGMSIGTSVLVARYYGANQAQNVSETVHTSIAISAAGGIAFGVLGLCVSRPMLEWMATPEDVINGSTLYMHIYFAGLPAMALYNFGAAILRAVGDTKRPLYFLTAAGAINVALNLFFVIVLDMDVAGVALATVISEVISAVLIVGCLLRSDGSIRLIVRKIRISGGKLREIVKIGLPAGIQGSVFSISNVIIQSSVNAFGSTIMAANSAAGNLEGFVYVIMNSFYQAALTFTGQNIGAGRKERIGRILRACMLSVTAFGLFFGLLVYLLGHPLLSIYSTDPDVITYGIVRLSLVCAPYFLCGQMEVMVGMMRGMGYSFTPMIVAMTGVCGFRLGWLYTFFARNKTLEMLYVSYPISWLLTMLVHAACFVWAYRKLRKQPETAAAPS